MRPVLALDIGGSKLAAALVDAGGRLLRSARQPTPQGTDAEAVWWALVAVLTEALGTAPEDAATAVSGVGVGCGGPMQWPAGEVSPLNVPAWRGFPLRARLTDLLPGLRVRLHNDAVCAAAGEHWRGAGRGVADMAGMVVSTGVGGGLVLGDRLVDGGSGNAGHVGHVQVQPDGPRCTCGSHGCVEAIARGPAVVGWAVQQGWRPRAAVALVATAASPTAADVAADAARGHPVALAALARAGHALGTGIASMTNLLDLDVVAVGGGLSQAGPMLFDPLEQALRAHATMPFAGRVRVVPAALGQQAGLVGAAALVLRGDRYWSAD